MDDSITMLDSSVTLVLVDTKLVLRTKCHIGIKAPQHNLDLRAKLRETGFKAEVAEGGLPRLLIIANGHKQDRDAIEREIEVCFKHFEYEIVWPSAGQSR